MRVAWIILGIIVSGTSSLARAQENVVVRVLANGTCDISGTNVACAEVGMKLRSMHVPENSVIGLQGDLTVTYAPVAAAISSIKSAGYRTKTAHITGGSE
jgi:biopolymer transport protein ExbD